MDLGLTKMSGNSLGVSPLKSNRAAAASMVPISHFTSVICPSFLLFKILCQKMTFSSRKNGWKIMAFLLCTKVLVFKTGERANRRLGNAQSSIEAIDVLLLPMIYPEDVSFFVFLLLVL
jgi:hypothetical protein